jgi:oxygen-independent coproporphyrinogen-3 oxidase
LRKRPVAPAKLADILDGRTARCVSARAARALLFRRPEMELADLKRLVIDVPRYTSYPTAAEFSPAVGADAFATSLREAAASTNAPLSLYVHLPFCKAICHFCGCHALVARTPERIARYLGALGREMELVAGALDGARPVAELHFGGGSPSLLPASDFEQLMQDLRTRFPFADDVSISIEADPRTTDRDKLDCYRRQGVTRISFGFQDLDPGVQRAIGRDQSADTSRGVYALAREVGFEGINVDLCYGLPEQTEETFAHTIDEVVRLRPDRVALFGYAHVPWLKPKQKLIVASTLPGVDLRLRLVADAHARLAAGGYVPIGFDHFALPEDPLAEAARAGRLHRNFQGYTTTTTDALVGLGLSAISDLPTGYAQNARALGDYYAALDNRRLPTERGALRSSEDRMRGDLIRRIMCAFRIDRRDVERCYGISFATDFGTELEALERLEGQGLVTVSEAAIELTELGRLFVRNVAVVFDAYRKKAPAEAPRRFSASV